MPRAVYISVFSFFSLFLYSHAAFADIDIQADISDIAENIVESSDLIPMLIASVSYLIGLFLGVMGILKLKEHVDNPSQVPVRTGVIRLLVGGAMFALPVIYGAMQAAITPDNGGFDNGIFSPIGAVSGVMGAFAGLLGDIGWTRDFNAVLSNIIISLESVPALIAAIAYALGLLMGVQGLLKLKDYVENPDQNPLKEAVVRFVIGGALFAIPSVYGAMLSAIADGDGNIGITGIIGGVLDIFDMGNSAYDDVGCTSSIISDVVKNITFGFIDPSDDGSGGKATIGTTMCGIIGHTSAILSFLNAIAYLFGLVLGLMALLKIRDHVLNPQNVPLSQGISRLAAGGAFFALPVIVETIRASVTPGSSAGTQILGFFSNTGDTVSGYNVGGETCGQLGFFESMFDTIMNIGSQIAGIFGFGGDEAEAVTEGVGMGGLDVQLYCAITDILGPLHSLLNFFTLVAGTIFIMIGISRLLKSEQDGARGPGGIGTIMTFLTGGMLLAFSDFVRLATATLFSTSTTATFATIQYTDNAAELAHTQLFVSAIIKFLIMVGLISFVRGLFIMRGVAEGDNNSSMMAGMTHIIGGTLAVNIGPFLNLVQATLGITNFGIVFQ